ncbi:MAG: zinc ribbon domain-containing protein [Halobacteriaceae archaeon]
MSTGSGDDVVYCRECGAEIRRAAEICPECGVRQRPPPSATGGPLLDGRNPLVAALLSAVFPGLGHVYARDVDTGLFFAVSFLLAVFSLLFAVGFVLVPAIWLYAIYDAAKAAERRDRELSPSRPPRPEA